MILGCVLGALIGAISWIAAIPGDTREYWLAWSQRLTWFLLALSVAVAALSGAALAYYGGGTVVRPSGSAAVDGTVAAAVGHALIRTDFQAPRKTARRSVLNLLIDLLEDGLNRTTRHWIRKWVRRLRGQQLIDESFDALRVIPGRRLSGPDAARAQELQQAVDRYEAARTAQDASRAADARSTLQGMLIDHYSSDRHTRDAGRPSMPTHEPTDL